ncbi:MAG: hypothetical protein ACFFC7_03105 [Candidatus Hermodarchaeota archaeon]
MDRWKKELNNLFSVLGSNEERATSVEKRRAFGRKLFVHALNHIEEYRRSNDDFDRLQGIMSLNSAVENYLQALSQKYRVKRSARRFMALVDDLVRRAHVPATIKEQLENFRPLVDEIRLRRNLAYHQGNLSHFVNLEYLIRQMSLFLGFLDPGFGVTAQKIVPETFSGAPKVVTTILGYFERSKYEEAIKEAAEHVKKTAYAGLRAKNMEIQEEKPLIDLLEDAVRQNIITNPTLISEFSQIVDLYELDYSDDISPQDIWEHLQYLNHLDILPWKVSPTKMPPAIGLYTYSQALAVSSNLLITVEEYLHGGFASRLLFIGPRGSGKTYALGYFNYFLSTHPAYFPIILKLRKETTSGIKLLCFLLESLSYQIANNQLLNEFDREKIQNLLLRIKKLPASKSSSSAIRQLLDQFARGKKVVLLIENISCVLKANEISKFFNKLLEYIGDPEGRNSYIISGVSLEFYLDSLREQPWENFQPSYVQPFSQSEIATWLTKRLRLANIPEDIFSTSAIRKIFQASKGNLHIVNDIVQYTLSICQETGLDNVDLPTINKVLLELELTES